MSEPAEPGEESARALATLDALDRSRREARRTLDCLTKAPQTHANVMRIHRLSVVIMQLDALARELRAEAPS